MTRRSWVIIWANDTVHRSRISDALLKRADIQARDEKQN
jgi:hypothetical protein